MTDDHLVTLSQGLPTTVLPEVPADWSAELAQAEVAPAADRRAALAMVAGAHPTYIAAWASLAEITADPVEAYAYARVGYHRGLDALRAAGWRGSGYVRWQEESNRGFLRSLMALAKTATTLNDTSEADRCSLFLRQLDPEL